MPVQTPVEQAASQANAAVLTSTEGMGCFSLPGAVRRFARAQIGLVSQAELVLLLGRVMEIRFLEAMGVPVHFVAGHRRESDARGCAQHLRASYNADPSLGLDHGGWDASSDSEGGCDVEGSAPTLQLSIEAHHG